MAVHCRGDEPIQNIRSLLYRVARNSVVDFYRKRAHADVTHDEELLLTIPDDRQQHLLDEIDVGVDMKRLERYLRRLKDEYREVILLRYVEELTLGEIAKALDKSSGAVRVLLHRAIKVLKHVITSEDLEVK
jgi:RNA polymerase sigma-70 factor (ECF subfamily)